jgi:hypothetical protein
MQPPRLFMLYCTYTHRTVKLLKYLNCNLPELNGFYIHYSVTGIKCQDSAVFGISWLLLGGLDMLVT